MNKPIRSKWGMLLHFLRGNKRWFLFAILFGLLRTLCSMLNPQLVQFTVDSVIGTEEGSGMLAGAAHALFSREELRAHLGLIAGAIIVLAVIAGVCRHFFVVCNVKGGEGFVRDIRDGLYRHLERLPLAWHTRNQTGDLIQRCTTDVEQVKTFLSDQLSGLVNCVITLVCATVFMFFVNRKLALLVLATQPLLLAYTLYFRGKISTQFRLCDECEGELSTIAQENLTGVRVVRAFGRESYERARFDEKNLAVTKKWIRMGLFISSFFEISVLLGAIQAMLVITVGSYLTVHEQMTAGALLAMISYTATAGEPIRMLGRIVSEMGKAGVSLDRLYEIIRAEEEQDPPEAVEPDMTGDIRFEHVHFAYPDCPELLHDVDLTIPAGATVGILGSTGSGKSTLMQLLDRLYDLPPENGRITIGGVDIASMPRDWVRGHIGMVLQEPMLFSRTLAENIGLTLEHATLEQIREASAAACLDDAVEGFAAGYDTIVGERGVTLSGGQKQRAAIARMLLQKAPIMVFDDSLSAVDAETDAKIRAALARERAGATCILISHRISSLMEADRIAVLENGRIVEQGTHDELMAMDGVYSRIYRMQLSPETEVENHV